MREFIDSRDVANTVMMLATAFDGTIAVVEGVTDRRLYGKFFDKDRVEVIIAHSKSNVRNTIRETFKERKFRRVVGIIDADLDRLTGKAHNAPLFLTDTRDSEGMMLNSKAFDDILDEYGDRDRMDRFTDSHGSIKKAIMSAAYPIGLLMYLSETKGLGFSFKELDYEYFIDRKTLKCDVKRMIENIMSRSRAARHVSVKNVYQMILTEEEHEKKDVCRGHDLMAVMAIGLKYIFGANNSRNLNDDILSGSFRLAYDRDDIESTELYRESSEWCKENDLALWVRP
ncbi:MAG: DUF4435 domain-containing protein [Candidatus Methanomethylophilaceae archaeon]|nr:DUF4435 domain-containing protein [Candidatus Methanomethylophilaceae archaeon]